MNDPAQDNQNVTSLVFLDIDGVLTVSGTGCDAVPESAALERWGTRRIATPAVEQLDRILRRTGAAVVITSTWRYAILRGDISLRGFEMLLRSHGASSALKVAGCLATDDLCPHCLHLNPEQDWKKGRLCAQCGMRLTRGAQITSWLSCNGHTTTPHVVLDDFDDGIREAGHLLVIVPRRFGLGHDEAERAIALLGAK